MTRPANYGRLRARDRDVYFENKAGFGAGQGIKPAYVEVPEVQRQTLSRGVLRRAERLALNDTQARDAIGLSNNTWEALHTPRRVPRMFERKTLEKIATWLHNTRPRENLK